MKLIKKSVFLHFSIILLAAIFIAWLSNSAKAEGGSTLAVKQLNAAFDVAQGGSRTANVVFLDVRIVDDNDSVRALP